MSRSGKQQTPPPSQPCPTHPTSPTSPTPNYRSTPYPTPPTEKKVTKDSGSIWNAANNAKGPAGWRKYKGGTVHGLVRRKGERDPKRYGLYFDDVHVNHPKYATTEDLPQLSAAGVKRRQKEIAKAEDGERKRVEKELEQGGEGGGERKGLLERVFGGKNPKE